MVIVSGITLLFLSAGVGAAFDAAPSSDGAAVLSAALAMPVAENISAAKDEVSSTSELADRAVGIEAPIKEVTVFGDRARITRQGRVNLTAGINIISFPDLPGGIWVDTVRVGAEERILRVEISQVERLFSGIDKVQALIEKIEALDREIAALNVSLRAHEQELSWMGRISPAPLPDSPDFPRILVPGIWPSIMDFLDERRTGIRGEIQNLSIERRTRLEKRRLLVSDLVAMKPGTLTRRNFEVIAVIESPRNRRGAPLSLEYTLPGATWKPAYELHFQPDTGDVTLAAFGQVKQSTGEDWVDAKLRLSTAMPARGLEMPLLLTWALGEARDFIPQPRSVHPREMFEPPLFPLPPPPSATVKPEFQQKIQTIERALENYSSDTARAQPAPSGIGGARGAPPPARSARRPAPRPEPIAEADEMDYLMAEEAAYEVLAEPRRARLSRRSESAKRVSQEKAITDAESETMESPSGFVLADPSERKKPPPPPRGSLAYLAGGLDFVYPVLSETRVASTGEEHRLPLYSESFNTRLFYKTSPGLKETAFLKAEVVNTGQRPVLGGAAGVFVSGAYTGDSSLDTIGPGGSIRMPLGADEDIRINRVVVPETETTGVLRREEVTVYTHRIEVANYKGRPVSVTVLDQIPITANENIRIETESMNPSPVSGPVDVNGLTTWELDIPPGETAVIEFRYRIRRPLNWQLFQKR